MQRVILAHLWPRTDDRPGLSGRMGHLRVQVVPIEGAGPNEPSHALVLAETTDTRPLTAYRDLAR